MRVGVIGTGYVGLVTGACFAYLGHSVICTDNSAEKIAVLASGGMPIWEPGLRELITEAAVLKRIQFTTDMRHTIEQSDVLILCVGTPSGHKGEADLSQLMSAVAQIERFGSNDQVVIVKSTVPVGTTDEIAAMLQLAPHLPNVEVIHNPEFLRQGSAVRDFLQPDRIVAGCQSERAKDVIAALYGNVPAPIHICGRRSAELIKYASNAFLAMKISFINMIADISEQTGGQIDDIAKGIGMDRRIGESFLRAGIGYGGSCFPKDIQSFRNMGERLECALPLLDATESVNRERPQRLLNKLKAALGSLERKRIALLGLTFKPMTDDLREAPSLSFSKLCLEHGAEVHAFDPFAAEFPVRQVVVHRDLYAAIEHADAIVILTEWEQLKQLNWRIVSKTMRTPVVVDGRNMFEWEYMRDVSATHGITYLSVGRPALHAAPTEEAVMFEW